MLTADGDLKRILFYEHPTVRFFLEFFMSNVSPANAGGGAEAGLAKMEAAFDRAIEMSAKVTEITTEKKAELDASKQRPN